MLRRWVLGLTLVLVAFTALAWSSSRLSAPAGTRMPIAQPGPTIVIGVPEATWSNLDQRTRPGSFALVQAAATGVLLPRATSAPTCTPDAWLSVSAARGADARCQVPRLIGGTTPGSAVRIAGWEALQRTNDDRHRARIGTVASMLATDRQCVSAVGASAALAAADRQGRVGHYFAAPSAAALTACPVTLVDLSRAGAAPADSERALETVFTHVPADATIVLAGISDGGAATTSARELMILGPGVPPGVLATQSTRQPGVVQLADLSRLLLARTEGGAPQDDASLRALTGATVTVRPGQQPPGQIVAERQRQTAALTHSNRLALPFVVITGLLTAAVVAVGGWRWWRTGHPPRWLAPAAVLLGSIPVGSYLVGALPWWSGGPVELWFALGVVALSALVAAVAYAGPWRSWAAGPPLVVAAITLTVVAVDVISGSRLQLLAAQGLLPLQGGRFYGMGNAGFGFYASAALLTGGLIGARLIWWDDADQSDRRLAAATIALLGGGAAVIDAVPFWGADLGGPPALLVATAVLVARTLGLRLTVRRAVLIAGGALALVAVAALADWRRPPQARTHLGGFVQQLLDGSAAAVIGDKVVASLALVVANPVNPVAVALLALAWVMVLRPPSRTAAPLRAWHTRLPLARPLSAALLLLWSIALVLNDSGLAALATGSQLAVPLLMACAAGFAVAERTPPRTSAP